MEDPNYNFSDEIPEHTLRGLKDFFEYGSPPGSFVRAVLENNFIEAFKCADHVNLRAMFSIARWMYSEAPSRLHYGTWGSPEAVERHITRCTETRLKEGGR